MIRLFGGHNNFFHRFYPILSLLQKRNAKLYDIWKELYYTKTHERVKSSMQKSYWKRFNRENRKIILFIKIIYQYLSFLCLLHVFCVSRKSSSSLSLIRFPLISFVRVEYFWNILTSVQSEISLSKHVRRVHSWNFAINLLEIFHFSLPLRYV